jgi:NTE family protein
MGRHKDIMYSAHAPTPMSSGGGNMDEQCAYQALTKVPEASLSEEERRLKQELSDLPEISILHIIYQQKAYEGHAKDYEFSGTSMREHWQSGYEDTKRTLKRKEWLTMPPPGSGIVVHDVHREEAL